MKVLLLKSVQKVGKKDDIVEVAEGFANHALFPKKLAVPATAAAIASRDTRIKQVQTEKQIRHALLDTLIKDLSSQTLVMKVTANGQGNLFSKVHARDIVSYLATVHRTTFDESQLVVPDIKKVGSYTIGVEDEGYRSHFTLELKA